LIQRPVEIDELRRSVERLKLEELALKKEKDEASKKRLQKLQEDLGQKQQKLDALNVRWEKERSELNKIGDLKPSLIASGFKRNALSARGTSKLPQGFFMARFQRLKKT